MSKPCGVTVTGVYGQIRRIAAQGLQGGGKLRRIASVEVVSSVAVGKEGVSRDHEAISQQADRALGMTGGRDDLQRFGADGKLISVFKQMLGGKPSFIGAEEIGIGIFFAVSQHFRVIIVDVSGRAAQVSQPIKRGNMIEMSVGQYDQLQDRVFLIEKAKDLMGIRAWIDHSRHAFALLTFTDQNVTV